MGCFISTNSAAPPPSKTRRMSSSVSDQHGGSKSPPPVDEETVKEVLSETPAIPKRLAPPAAPRFCGSEEMIQRSGGGARSSGAALSNDYLSDVNSEIHSTRNESFSTGNDGAFRWRPMLNGRPFPSYSKREKTAGRSPALRSDTPGRVKSGSGNSRKTGGGDKFRSGSGSSKTGLHASKSTRKTGEHPGRVGCGSGERNRKGGEEERVPPTNSELLESSLVSLECFIFL